MQHRLNTELHNLIHFHILLSLSALSHSRIFLGPNCGPGQSCELSFHSLIRLRIAQNFLQCVSQFDCFADEGKFAKKKIYPQHNCLSANTHFYGTKLRQNFKFGMVVLNKSPKIFRTISRADFKNSSASMLNFHIKQFLFSQTMLLEIRLQDLIHLARNEQNVLFFPHKM